MDVQMPVLGGHDATRRIRIELGLLDLPIIALTAGALSSERERAEAAGMNSFITKPFDADALVKIILRHVKPTINQLERRLGGGGDPGGSVPWPDIEGIDAPDVRSRLGDDLQLFGSMLRRLFSEFSSVAIP